MEVFFSNKVCIPSSLAKLCLPLSLQSNDHHVFQINDLSKDTGRRDTIFDKVFKAAVKEFHEFVITAKGAQDSTVEYRYKELMLMFESSLKSRVKNENLGEDFPTTLGINAFRGFLDEFNKRRSFHKHEPAKEKKKKKGGNRHEEKKDQPVTVSLHLSQVKYFSILWCLE